jgi:hypothetical protein
MSIRRALVLTFAAAVITAAGLFGLSLLWLGAPKPTPGGLGTAQLLDVAKLVLGIVAGVGGVVALVVAYRKQRIAEAGETREQVKLYAERFYKASEMLGSDSAAVRLAGVHALAALADDWFEERQMCIDVLCAYLRMPSPPAPIGEDKDVQHAEWSGMREVRRTIIRLIAEHLQRDAAPPWRGVTLDFTGVVFDENIDFSDADFAENGVRFTDAVFSDGLALFTRAEFTSGWVYFDGARFSGAHVLFTDCRFAGAQVSFVGATFRGGRVSFQGADFAAGGLHFHGAAIGAPGDGRPPLVSFTDAKFNGGTVDLENTRWTNRPEGLPDQAPGLSLPKKNSPPDLRDR